MSNIKKYNTQAKLKLHSLFIFESINKGMMNYILFDSKSWEDLKPLTFTRPVAALRVGILTIKEKWEKRLAASLSYKTQDYLSEKFPCTVEEQNILINGSVLPTDELVKAVRNLSAGESLVFNGELIAAFVGKQDFAIFDYQNYTEGTEVSVNKIEFAWDIFIKNPEQIEVDFELITKGRVSEPISETNQVLSPENVFVEKGASIECAIINARNGKVYIGVDAEIMEGAVIRGPFALCEHSAVKMSAKIYEGTTIGPHSKVGGEVQNSVLQAYSNKGHDGYLGNSVLGEWCNLGADTNNSNLKNDYSAVRVWHYPSQRFYKTGLQFCGLIMGDHSKSAINTMFNTGTVVGVSANVFGEGFPRNFVPSFSWGGSHGLEVYPVKKASMVANKVFARRSKKFDEVEERIFEHIFEETKQFRRF